MLAAHTSCLSVKVRLLLLRLTKSAVTRRHKIRRAVCSGARVNSISSLIVINVDVVASMLARCEYVTRCSLVEMYSSAETMARRAYLLAAHIGLEKLYICVRFAALSFSSSCKSVFNFCATIAYYFFNTHAHELDSRRQLTHTSMHSPLNGQ